MQVLFHFLLKDRKKGRSSRREEWGLARLPSPTVHQETTRAPCARSHFFLTPRSSAQSSSFYVGEDTDSEQPCDLTFLARCVQGVAEQRSHSLGPCGGEAYFYMGGFGWMSERKSGSWERLQQLPRRLHHVVAGCYAMIYSVLLFNLLLQWERCQDQSSMAAVSNGKSQVNPSNTTASSYQRRKHDWPFAPYKSSGSWTMWWEGWSVSTSRGTWISYNHRAPRGGVHQLIRKQKMIWLCSLGLQRGSRWLQPILASLSPRLESYFFLGMFTMRDTRIPADLSLFANGTICG